MNRTLKFGSITIAIALTICHCYPTAMATPITAPTAADYLLIARGSSSTAVGVKVSSSNSLGRIFTVPSGSNPDVDDNPPWPLPANGTPPTSGISNDGNIAITNSSGNYDLADIGVWSDIGIRCENGVTGRCQESFSNSTLHSGTFANDPTGMDDIEDELDAAHATISGLSGTTGWTLSGEGSKNGTTGHWQLNSDGVDNNTTITLASGLNVIVIDTGSNDMKINNAGLVIDGPADAGVIFVLEDQENDFLFSNASISIGSGGIGNDAVLFAMLDGGNGSNFDFSKVIVNGAAFWDLSEDGGQINMDNVQGCGQWVGDHLNFNDVQLARCAVGEEIPEPGTLSFVAAAALALASRRKRRCHM
ncbi:MAG: hypothetical protein AAGD11_02280 [Planctomycetota bacterium]